MQRKMLLKNVHSSLLHKSLNTLRACKTLTYLVFVHELWPTDRLRDGNQKVVRVSVNGRKRFQKNMTVWSHPQRPGLVICSQFHLTAKILSPVNVFFDLILFL